MKVDPTSAAPIRENPALGRGSDHRVSGRDVIVILDDDPAMALWSKEIAQFVEALRAQRLFNTVTTVQASVADSGIKVDGLDASGVAAGQHRPRAVLLVTHGRSVAWRDGLFNTALGAWAATVSVAIVNLLPQQHWYDRGMQTAEVTWPADDQTVPTGRRTWALSGPDLGSPTERDSGSVVAVPVLERGADWLRQWSRLFDGISAAPVHLPALLIQSGHRPAPRRGGPMRADEIVAKFRATVSPQAFALATRLAAVPLNMRAIRAVQRSKVRCGALELTEVLTSDLVRPAPRRQGGSGDLEIAYEFAHGVRERLLAHGYRDRTIEVQHLVESELARDIEALRNLTLRIKDPGNATYQRITPVAGPYLNVELSVHLSLGGPNLLAAGKLAPMLGSPIPAQLRRSARATRHSPDSRMEPEVSETMSPSGSSNVPGARHPLHGDEHDREGGNVSLTREDVSNVPPREDVSIAPRRDSRALESVPPRNPNFTGRRELLDELHQRLRAGTTAVLPEAVHGAGGVGKSQLVIEYVYRHHQDFDLIWYVPSERPAQIQSALAELAAYLDLPVPSTANTAVPAALEALRVGRPYANWLLVFDNAEDPDDVERFFPQGGPGSIVVTSRNEQWRDRANSLPVDVFDRQESIELLRRRGPDVTVDEADRLAAALEDLPLAIEQAAAYRAENKTPISRYLELLQANVPTLEDATDGEQPDYPPAVAAAWNISLDSLREKEPSALRLLQACAFFASEPISKVLLTKPRALRIDPDLDLLVRNPNRLNQVIRTIGRLSLARRDHRTNSIQLHRLVQRVLISQMDADDREAMQHAAHLLLAGNDPGQPDDAEHWPRYAELYPHIVASEAERCPDELVRAMVLNEAKYLWRWGDHVGARDLSLRALEAWTAAGDGTDPDTLEMATWLSFMHFVVGDYASAARLNDQTLGLYQETLGEDAEETLGVIGAIAADHRVAGDFEGALKQASTVYEKATENFGDEDPFTLRAAHNLAVSMRLSGLFGKAMQLDNRTYERLVQVFGTDHPDTLSTFGGINLDRRELGDYVAAHAAQERVVARARRVLKYDDHPDLLRQDHMLASFRRKAGEHHRALELSSDVQRRFRSRYGSDHPDTVLASLTASIDQRVTGDLGAARESGESAIKGLRALYGDDHPHTAGAEVDWAVTLRLLGEAELARDIDQSALARLTSRLGESHVLVIAARINLASDHFALGDVAEAHALDTESFARCRKLLGPEHPTTLACGANLAMDLRELHEDAEASALFEDVIERFRDKLGEAHPATAAATAGARANCDIDPLPL